MTPKMPKAVVSELKFSSKNPPPDPPDDATCDGIAFGRNIESPEDDINRRVFPPGTAGAGP